MLLLLGYTAYWTGDVLDGIVARRTGTETRLGAVLDIGCDRLCCGVLATIYLVQQPEARVALGVFLFQFMVADLLLSLGFLRWPIVSPNYFWQVDRRLYDLNWSPPAKTANTGLLLVLVTAGLYDIGEGLALLQLALKLWSLAVLWRLPGDLAPDPAQRK